MAAVGSIPETGTADQFSPEQIAELINAEFEEIYGKLGNNLWINSDFRFNQRGAVSYDTDGYSLDRVRIRPGGGASMTVSQGSPLTDDAEFSLLWERPAAGGATDIVEQRFEDVRSLGGKRVVVSFDIISDEVGDIEFALDILQHFGSGGSADVSTVDIIDTATTTLQRKIHAIDVPSVSGKTIGANNYTSLRLFRGTTQDNGDMRIGNIDVRIVPDTFTPTVAPHVPIDPAIELARAQFYYRTFAAGINGFALNASRVDMGVTFPAMRIAPAFSLPDSSIIIERENGSGSTSSGSAFVFTRSSETGGRVSINGFTLLTTGENVISDQTTPWLAADSEL